MIIYQLPNIVEIRQARFELMFLTFTSCFIIILMIKQCNLCDNIYSHRELQRHEPGDANKHLFDLGNTRRLVGIKCEDFNINREAE